MVRLELVSKCQNHVIKYMSITFEQAKEYYVTDKISLSAIERQYGYNRKLLSKQLIAVGIDIAQNNQLYKYNTNFFSSINTEEKAYWLGFLFADGYIRSKGKTHILEVALKSTDRGHLEKLRMVLCPELRISEKTIHAKTKDYFAVKVSITNKEIVEQLIALGCVNSKSKIITVPAIPKDMLRFFYRGYFDGDGSIGYYNGKWVLSICSGSKEFIDSFQHYCKDAIPGYTEVSIKKDARADVFSIQKGGNLSGTSIIKHLYSNASIYLDRKYAYFDTLPSEKEISQIMSAE